ncbi:MAG: cation diffusion facilitator family transporter [Eubacteriales bacterium]|nr:cation diffusion facilitator family transporter [Clostridiales bacterium]MDD6372473.1 cation diffusion facilitator family transporter [Eubacteriales bacterium]MDD7259352.1 cation diffusion facilitator family transporter [Eubacteriales bacterium]MDY6067995.1 cation diffusion facilitator family transporter [Candidatus Faecousia sp.]
MTNWLLRTFIKNSDHSEDPKVRAAIGILSGIVGIVCNVLLCGGKLAVGIATGSVSITADAMNNLSDATSSVVTMLGFRLAERPADEEHPFGHARYEYLSGLAVSALILIIGVELAKSSLDKVLHPAAVEFGWTTAAVLVGSILVKLWMSLFNTRLSKTIHSATLAATAADSRNDVITTSAVLLAALIEHFTAFRADGWMGLAVSCFILYSGVGLAKDTISPLLGENADPELREKIVDNIRACPKVLGFHDLMVHDYGPGQRFASIHVEMDRREDPMECHEIIDDLERECLKSHGVHLVIHYDPVVTNDPELDRMHVRVEQLLHTYDIRLGVHDFRMVPGKGHVNLIFDVVLPTDLRGQEADITAALEKALNQGSGVTYYPVITFDQSSFN